MSKFLGKIETFWKEEITENVWYFDTALKYINLIISTILLGGLAVVLAHFHTAWWVIILVVVFLFLPLLILVSSGVSKAGLFRRYSTPPDVHTYGAFELKRSYQTNFSAGEILAGIFHIVVIFTLLFYSHASTKPPEDKGVVRTKTVAELTRPPVQVIEPPPSISPTTQQGPPPEPSTLGPVTPTPEETQRTIATQQQLGGYADRAAEDTGNVTPASISSDIKIDLVSYSPQTATQGSRINLQVSLANRGNVTMQDVSGSLATATPLAKIIEKENHFGSIDPGTVSNSQTPFVIKFDDNIPLGQVHFILKLKGENPKYSNELNVGPINIIASIGPPSLRDTIESLARQELIPRIRWLREVKRIDATPIGPLIKFTSDRIEIQYDGLTYQIRYDYSRFAGNIAQRLPLEQLVQLPDIELRLKKALLLSFLHVFNQQFPDYGE